MEHHRDQILAASRSCNQRILIVEVVPVIVISAQPGIQLEIANGCLSLQKKALQMLDQMNSGDDE